MTKPKVLVVEDDDALRTALVKAFDVDGFSVEAATDGRFGMAAAEKFRPEVIVMDLLMPNMDGYEMLKVLHTTTWGSKIPVVVASNLGSIESINECLSSGVNDYIVKSDVSLKELVALTRNRLVAA